MKNVHKGLTAASVAILLCAAVPAANAATKAEVAKARSECAANKAKVKSMERSKNGDALAQAKATWEESCQRAEVLINELAGTQPPKVVAPTSS